MKFLRKLALPLALAAAFPAAHAATLGTLSEDLSHTTALVYPPGPLSDFVSFSIAQDDSIALLGVTGLLTTGKWGVYSAADFGSPLLAGLFDFGTGGQSLVLDSGTYYVGYNGLSLTNLGIVVTGGIAVVPEPETYAMLLAGLGMLGLIVRRRQNQSHGF